MGEHAENGETVGAQVRKQDQEIKKEKEMSEKTDEVEPQKKKPEIKFVEPQKPTLKKWDDLCIEEKLEMTRNAFIELNQRVMDLGRSVNALIRRAQAEDTMRVMQKPDAKNP